MGIRIHSAVAYGVQFTKCESRLYEKTMKGKSRDLLLRKWVELALSKETKEFSRYSCHQAFNFIKFTKAHKPVKPYQPFWTGWSEEKFSKNSILDLASDNLKRHERVSESESLERFELWEPDNDRECKPSNILGFVVEDNYAREVDYALVDHFNLTDMKDDIIVIKGHYPWEAGTSKVDKRKNVWHTHNGQHMISNLPLPLLQKVLIHHGTKKEFIKLKKDIWDKHHGDLKPYQIYSGDGWWGADFHFYPVDILFQTVAKLVPGIKYDIMRLQKFLCFYWS
jgi:hypothetical protein